MADRGRVQKLTKRAVDAARPAKARFVIWDTDLPGFGLRIEPTGRKTFIARYRAGGGRAGVLRQATIGRYGTVTVEEAKAAARRTLGAAASGKDPVGDRRAERQRGITVNEVCDWYLREAEGGRILGRRGKPIKRSTLATDRSRIDSHVRPLLGRRPVRSLSLHDVEGFQADIAVGKTARSIGKTEKRPRGGISRGGGGTGARTLVMLRAIFEHAMRLSLIEVNPARGARKLAGRARRTRLSLDQVRSLGQSLRDAAAAGQNEVPLAAVRLILLTGLRKSEALGLKPGWILPTGGIDFPDTKSGAQVRPIGKAALNLLAGLSARNEEWVFPAERGDGHFVGLPKVLGRLCTLAELMGVTLHTLRHAFASIAGDLGYSELTIAGLLGHAAGSVTSSYVHLDSALVAAADRVAGVIADALDGKPDAQIIPLASASEKR